jgi:hypothetical protein
LGHKVKGQGHYYLKTENDFRSISSIDLLFTNIETYSCGTLETYNTDHKMGWSNIHSCTLSVHKKYIKNSKEVILEVFNIDWSQYTADKCVSNNLRKKLHFKQVIYGPTYDHNYYYN